VPRTFETQIAVLEKDLVMLQNDPSQLHWCVYEQQSRPSMEISQVGDYNAIWHAIARRGKLIINLVWPKLTLA